MAALADFPLPRHLRARPVASAPALLPTSQDAPQVWRYALNTPPENWSASDFDDSGWKEGPGGFGTAGTPGAVVRTEWKTQDIWLRRAFEAGDLSAKELAWRIHFDEDPEVYLNGVPAARFPGYSTSYSLYRLDPPVRAVAPRSASRRDALRELVQAAASHRRPLTLTA
jgi:hypothetical protein